MPAAPVVVDAAAAVAAPQVKTVKAKTPKLPREKKAKAPKAPKAVKLKAPKAPKPVKLKAPKPPKAARKPKPIKTPKPPRLGSREAGARLSALAGVIGALGLLISVVLAVGALFIALDAAQGSAFFGHLSDLCDALAGPLKDVFTFSGANADKKEALVGWGLGSMGYLLVGRFLQSILQRRVDKS